jgi:hypothetical protein
LIVIIPSESQAPVAVAQLESLAVIVRMKSSFLLVCLVGLVLLGVAVWLGHEHGAAQHSVLVSAVTHQLDGHTPQIAALLTTMRGSEVSRIEDAAYQELQAIPSTSLISRSMIRVAPGADGLLECVIDTSSFDIAPRTIRASRSATSQ